MAADLPSPTSTIVLLPGPDWDGWPSRYATRGYDVRVPAPGEVEPTLIALAPPPIVMGPPAPVLDVLIRGLAVAGVALTRSPFGPRRAPGRLLRLRCTPGRPGWERAADRALSWAAEAADR